MITFVLDTSLRMSFAIMVIYYIGRRGQYLYSESQTTFFYKIIICYLAFKNYGNEKSIRPLKQAAANIKFLNLGKTVN